METAAAIYNERGDAFPAFIITYQLIEKSVGTSTTPPGTYL